MGLNKIVLLLAVATSAEGNLMPWQKVPDLKSLVNQVDSNGRRLQAAMMSADCQAACPKIMDFLTALGSMGDAGDDMAKMIEAMCPHEATISCIGANDVCQDDGTAEMNELFGMIGCMCACPEIGTMGEVKDDTPTAAQCKVLDCVMAAPADKCGAIQKQAETEEDAKKQIASCAGGGESSDHAAKVAPFTLLALSGAAALLV
jgi:hypothetical protein